jgi:dynein heavy chain, axonemal
MNLFVEASIGKKFTEATVSSMDEVFADTDYKTPLIFILS